MNGRIDIVSQPQRALPFQLFEEPKNERGKLNMMPNFFGNREKSPVGELFFSKKNVDALHEAIRYQVFLKSNKRHVIDRQSDTDLIIVMRSIYLENAKHLSYDIVGQVRRLNVLVLNEVVPKIMREIDMYITYIDDISRNPVPMPRSVLTSSVGTKSLPMREF